MKRSQEIMIWFLPLIIIAGLFFPALGVLVAAMMAFFLPLSFFKGRYWCTHLCPRGSFLDIVMPKASLKKPLPGLFKKPGFRLVVFVAFMAFLSWRIFQTNGNWLSAAAVFVSMCLITTIVSVFLAFFIRPRAWCAICPMGSLQERIHSLRKSRARV